MNWIKAFDIIPTILKAGALKIRILAKRKLRETEKEDNNSVRAERKFAWLDIIDDIHRSTAWQQYSAATQKHSAGPAHNKWRWWSTSSGVFNYWECFVKNTRRVAVTKKKACETDNVVQSDPQIPYHSNAEKIIARCMVVNKHQYTRRIFVPALCEWWNQIFCGGNNLPNSLFHSALNTYPSHDKKLPLRSLRESIPMYNFYVRNLHLSHIFNYNLMQSKDTLSHLRIFSVYL